MLFVADVSATSLQRLDNLPLRLLTVYNLRDSEKFGGVLPRMSSTLRKLTLENFPGFTDLSSVAELQELEELALIINYNVRTLEPVGQL